MKRKLLTMLACLNLLQASQVEIITPEKTHPYVATALSHFEEDVRALLGKPAGQQPIQLLVGTLGEHPEIDALISAGKLDVSGIEGQWEAFRIVSFDEENKIVIVGSDPRGTAYGVYSLSEHFGVSPWHWFADVTPAKLDALPIKGIDITWKPAVRYRGIFINDEKWGLQEWATKNFAVDEPLMGAKVYRKVFELMMRMKANSIWPSMWGGSSRAEWPGFFLNPNNLKAAQDYGIIMASSHGEALNASPAEWYQWTEENDVSPEWNYADNFEAMKAFWKERLAVSSQTENLYTIGLRGLNDEPMDGGSSQEEKIAIVENAIQTQRQLLSEAWGKPAEEIPQVFTPYKEVLPLFEAGLKIPDDVIIVYPDDDYGFIKRMPSLEPRSGGYGIYFHGDYYGGPKSFLWLGGTALELLYREMKRSAELDMLQVWIVNAGNVKLHEVATEYYIHLASHVGTDAELKPKEFLQYWAAREFGAEAAPLIAECLHDLENINYLCKPDHAMTGRFGREEGLEIAARLNPIAKQMEQAQQLIPEHRKDAFDQLVRFHVLASKYTHSMMIYETEHHRHRALGHAIAEDYGKLAMDAYHGMAELSRHFNEDISDGKWNHFMTGPQGGHNWDAPWQPLFERHLPDVREVEPKNSSSLSVWVQSSPVPMNQERGAIEARDIAIDELILKPAAETEEMHWSYLGTGAEIIPDSLSEDFTLSLEVEASHQFAVVFAYDDPENTHWVEFVCNSTRTQTGRILAGSRIPLTWNEQIRWPADTRNRMTIRKVSDLLQVFVDDQLLMKAQGHKVEGLRGQIGFVTRRGTATVRDVELAIHETNESVESTLSLIAKGQTEHRSFELFNHSSEPVQWTAQADADWIQINQTEGSLSEHTRVDVSVDWDRLGATSSQGSISIRSGSEVYDLNVQAMIPHSEAAVSLPSEGKLRLSPADLEGKFAKEHPAREMIHGLGRAGVMLPLVKADLESVPSITIPVEFTEAGVMEVQFHMLPTRENYPEQTVEYAISVGNEAPQVIDMLIRKNPWGVSTKSALQRHAVMEGIHTGRSQHTIDQAGLTTVKIWALTSGIDLEGIDIHTK